MASKVAAKAAGGVVSVYEVSFAAVPPQLLAGSEIYPSRSVLPPRWTIFCLEQDAGHPRALDNALAHLALLRSHTKLTYLRTQKQTLQSTGVWERFRRSFAIDPNRSSGVPLNPYFRNPAPGEPHEYHDPVTIPAGDIADNAYWKRDHRRAYPALSVVSQADAVALLSVGSAAKPRAELIGEAGTKALVAAQEEGQDRWPGRIPREERSRGGEGSACGDWRPAPAAQWTEPSVREVGCAQVWPRGRGIIF